MACGWSPDLMRMLEGVGDEKQKLAEQAALELQKTTQEVEAIKKRTAAAVADADGSKNSDWTAVYGKWDAWEDPEELAQREQQAREKQQRAAKAASAAGCNHDHSAEQKLMDMTTQEKLTLCDEFRVLGNAFFAQGQYQRAAYNYHKALVYFEYMFPDTEPEQQTMDALKLKTLVNFTACRLKTGHLDDVIHHATMALEMEPHSVKALYRRAQAYRLRDEFEKAQEDITAAMEIAKKSTEGPEAVDPLLVQEKQLLHAKMLAYKLKSRQISAAMFGNSGGAKASDTTKSSGWRPMTVVKDVPLTLTAGSVLNQSDSEWQLDETWRPSTGGMKELQQLLETL